MKVRMQSIHYKDETLYLSLLPFLDILPFKSKLVCSVLYPLVNRMPTS